MPKPSVIAAIPVSRGAPCTSAPLLAFCVKYTASATRSPAMMASFSVTDEYSNDSSILNPRVQPMKPISR